MSTTKDQIRAKLVAMPRTTGKVLKKTLEGDSLWVEIEVNDPDLLACIVPKGYIAVDGTSLTVCDVTDESFTLMLIEHTQKCIVLPLREIGDAVNLEVDVIAKYARRSVGDFEALSKRVADLGSPKSLQGLAQPAPGSDLTEERGVVMPDPKVPRFALDATERMLLETYGRSMSAPDAVMLCCGVWGCGDGWGFSLILRADNTIFSSF